MFQTRYIFCLDDLEVLYNPVNMEVHKEIGNIAYEVIKPIVNSSENIDRFIRISKWNIVIRIAGNKV